jgi:pimeloyl-ACP methyl ester carboxylesterase
LTLLIFSHANSFPARTYQVMFKSLRARGFKVRAIEKLGHEPAYPITNNWPHLAKQLTDFARAEIEKAGEPACLVGHSLGGYLSLMVAARHPELGGKPIQGVVLLDSPILGGWKATALQLAKGGQFVGSVSPARISRTRRTHWPSREAALAFFQGKKAFSRWEPGVLKDFIQHGLQIDGDQPGGPYSLGFNREIETAIYNTVPDNLQRLLRRHPLKCPVAFIGGKQSKESKQVGLALTEKITQGRVTVLDGSHLFPMEHPLATAAAIELAIRQIQAAHVTTPL